MARLVARANRSHHAQPLSRPVLDSLDRHHSHPPPASRRFWRAVEEEGEEEEWVAASVRRPSTARLLWLTHTAPDAHTLSTTTSTRAAVAGVAVAAVVPLPREDA
jgi:hypothetical protein